MLIPMELLRQYVDINIDDKEFVREFSLKSAEVDTFKPFCDVKGLVIGKIIAIKDHPDSNHLHITTVDFGDSTDEIVCGAPNVEVGRKVIVAKIGTKLPGGEIKKAVIRGVESRGMNCSLEELGIDSKFQGYDGIYYLDDNAPLGEDPIKYLHLDDDVLEIELTPNRQDLLSIIGVAYDAKAMCNSSMHLEELKYETKGPKADIKVSTETPNCLAYYSNIIRNVVIKESPSWLKGALMKMNIRPINNVVDITNYVLMVTGHPLHAFDYDYIKTKKVVVKMAKDGDKFVTLDKIERELTSEDIVITDSKEAICLGGVMGGLYSEVTNETKNVFLECANFNPECIKKTSKRLGLQSESSLRYEKGINPDLTKYALDLATKLLVELADGEVAPNSSSFDNEDYSVKDVKVSLKQINSNLGRDYTKEEINDVFSGLSFEFTEKNGNYTVKIPRRRPDISTYQDLIEEVVRINGLSKIESSIPPSTSSGHLTPYQSFVRKIRHSLSENLNEVITYSLVSESEAVDFDINTKSCVKLLNPLNDDRIIMRHSLIPSLLKTIKYNQNRKNNDVFIYEIGRSYTNEGEEHILSIAMTGMISNTMWDQKKEMVDFFYLKGLVQNLFDKLSIKNYSIVLPKEPFKALHPGVSAMIKLGKDEIGFMGKLHPNYEKKYEVKNVFVFEISLDKLFAFSHELKSVKEISKYPTMTRDLALVMDNEITCERLEGEIKRAAKRSLIDLKVFDLYSGENLGKGKKQIAISLTFGDNTRTLEAQEVDQTIKDILDKLSPLGIELRQ